jgi:hypothetical protein
MLMAVRAAVEAAGPVPRQVQAMLQSQDNPALNQLALRWAAAVQDMPRLVDALDMPERSDLRGVAASELKRWLGQQTGRESELYRLLSGAKRYPPEEARSFIQLLHPPREDEVTDPRTYERLIANLKHPQLAVRELAATLLYELAGEAAEAIEYDAGSPPEELDQAYRRWKQLVPGGKLPPGVGTKGDGKGPRE